MSERCRKCGNPEGYDTFWRDGDDPHYACGKCGERESEPQPPKEEKGPYQAVWDAGIKRHKLIGPGINPDDPDCHFGLRIEVEHIMDDLNSAFSAGVASERARLEKLEAELLGIYSQCSGCQKQAANWEKLKVFIDRGLSADLLLMKMDEIEKGEK